MEKFKNKVAVITGGNSGIGLATAKEFATHGANVIITGKRKDALEKASNEIGVKGILADQSNLEQINALVEEVKSNYENVDVLFLNAGVGSFAPIEYTEEEQFDRIIAVNLKGTFFTLQKFIPILNEGASVIFNGSNVASLNMPNSSVYSLSKSALVHLAKIASKELAEKNIRVNVVNPGPTMTEMPLKMGFDMETMEAMKSQTLSMIPLSKIGTPEDVASVVAYLADNETSSFITGSELFIDGGMAL